jgi:hypothetical protein
MEAAVIQDGAADSLANQDGAAAAADSLANQDGAAAAADSLANQDGAAADSLANQVRRRPL